MKNSIFLFLILMTVSCVANKYNVTANKGNFDQIEAGTKYAIYDFNNNKSIIEVTSVEKDSIVGNHKKEVISIAKKDIKEIDKIKTSSTVILIGSGVAVVAATWWLVDFTKTAGETIGVIVSGNP